MRLALPIAAALGVLSMGLLLSACQSTQDKAKALQEQGAANAASQVNLTIAKPDKEIKVLDQTLLHDQYGDAIVVELKNTSKQTVINAPILVDLQGADGKSVGKNDAPGLDLSLNHVPVIRPGETVEWVNDQLHPISMPKTAKVTVGPPEAPAPKGPLPTIEPGPPKVQTDSSGIEAAGSVANKSKVDQLKQVVYVVATQGNKIVAAGRGVIKNLKVGRPGTYSVFFIGDPKGAKVTVAAPPSTVQ